MHWLCKWIVSPLSKLPSKLFSWILQQRLSKDSHRQGQVIWHRLHTVAFYEYMVTSIIHTSPGTVDILNKSVPLRSLQPHRQWTQVWLSGCFNKRFGCPASALDLTDGLLRLFLLFIYISISSLHPQFGHCILYDVMWVERHSCQDFHLPILTSSLDCNLTKTGLFLPPFFPLRGLWRMLLCCESRNPNALDMQHLTDNLLSFWHFRCPEVSQRLWGLYVNCDNKGQQPPALQFLSHQKYITDHGL